MDYKLFSEAQFLIGISSKQYNMSKFIDGDKQIKAQKIFKIQHKHPQQLIDLKDQLENIKDYLVRLKQLPSAIKIQTSEMEIRQKDNQTHFVIKVNTPFCQYLTLIDFHKAQMLNPSHKIKYDEMFYIYFFEQFFELMIKGGGIKNFFYTNHNIWFMPPNSFSILEMGKLFVNKTSIAGLKFINGYHSITKEEFIEIYPSLPPNVYQLMKDKSAKGRAKLDLIIKIRSFAFLILTFVLKRVPQLFDQNFKPRIDCEEPEIKKLIEKSAQKMKLLILLGPIQQQIKQVQKLTKVNLRKFFLKVFTEIKQQDKLNWLMVYRVFFEKSIVNIESFNKTQKVVNQQINQIHQKQMKENKIFLENYVFFQKMIYQMWEMEAEKNFYIDRGFVQTDPLQVNMVYFLVKINGNFHRLLRYLNVVQLMKTQKFTEDSNKLALKLMQIFSVKLGPKDEQNPSEIYKIIKKSRQQSKMFPKVQNGNGFTWQQQSDSNIFNPFAFKNQKQQQLASKTYPKETLNFPSGPVQFLQNIYTYPVSTLKRADDRGKIEMMAISHKLENIINISNSLWFD